jgi:DNA-binding response OmpR family regulator
MPAKHTIMIVDDSETLRHMLAEQFMTDQQFESIEAATATDALSQLKTTTPHILLLNHSLPDMTGLAACTAMRIAGHRFPILMLLPQATEADTASVLEAGANDYVIKPFRFAQLLARLRALLRLHEHSDEKQLLIGPYHFKPKQKLLQREGHAKIRLTEKEAAILKYLLAAGEKSVSREELLTEVWGYNAGLSTHTLETHIYRLRQKIADDPSLSDVLVTDTGGYRLIP